MYKVTLEEIKVGDVLAKTILRENGDILLAAGYKLSNAVYRKLPDLNQDYFWIQTEELQEIDLEDSVSEHIALQTTNDLVKNAKLFREIQDFNNKSIEEIRKSIDDSGRFQGIIAVDDLQNSTTKLINDVLNKDSSMVNLNNIRNQSNYIHQHALDSTVISIMLGKKFGYTTFELEELAQGCLLMDVGYLAMPEELVNRTGRYSFSEFSLLKEHPTFGFAILRENPKIPLISSHVAYQHHERQDGGGYPRRLKGDNKPPLRKTITDKKEIHRFAEIAAVAETYMGLTRPRPHLPSKTPEETIKIMIKSAGSQLNKSIVDTLITMIPIFPIGSRIVVIANKGGAFLGYQGLVTKTNPNTQSRPEIVLVVNEKKQRLAKPLRVNLVEHPDLKIQFSILQ